MSPYLTCALHMPLNIVRGLEVDTYLGGVCVLATSILEAGSGKGAGHASGEVTEVVGSGNRGFPGNADTGVGVAGSGGCLG
jgi:hypothetical protein